MKFNKGFSLAGKIEQVFAVSTGVVTFIVCAPVPFPAPACVAPGHFIVNAAHFSLNRGGVCESLSKNKGELVS